MKNIKRYAASAILAGALAAPAVASTASAGPVDQDGLVNVVLTDTTIQVPIALAANICDVDINVIASQATAGDTTCTALAAAEARNPGRRDGGGPVRQSGLVNLFISDTTVQVPVAVALNLCDISANVLAQQVELGQQTTCTATAETIASRGA